MIPKLTSVRVTIDAVDQEGKARSINWELDPQSLQIEQLRELDGLPHPIEPEILMALPIRLTIRGAVLTEARA